MSDKYSELIDEVIRLATKCSLLSAENTRLRKALYKAYLDSGCRVDEAVKMTYAINA